MKKIIALILAVCMLTSMGITAMAETPEAHTVKGVWVWDNTPDVGVTQLIDQSVSFISDGQSFSRITCNYDSMGGYVPSISYYTSSGTSVTAYVGADGWYPGDIPDQYRTIDFGETEQTVSEDFYTWLTANAVEQKQIGGQWIFNDNITSIPYETFELSAASYDDREWFMKNHGANIVPTYVEVMDGLAVTVTRISPSIITGDMYDENGPSVLLDRLHFKAVVEESAYPELGVTPGEVITLWLEDDNIANSSSMVVDFGETQYVSPVFYDWLIANAKPYIPPKVYETTVTYGVDMSYIITVPDTVSLQLNSDANCTISITNAILPSRSVLNVTMSSDDGVWALKNSDNESIALEYTVMQNDQPVQSGDVVCSLNAGTTSMNTTVVLRLVEEPEQAGEYKDTITFAVALS